MGKSAVGISQKVVQLTETGRFTVPTPHLLTGNLAVVDGMVFAQDEYGSFHVYTRLEWRSEILAERPRIPNVATDGSWLYFLDEKPSEIRTSDIVPVVPRKDEFAAVNVSGERCADLGVDDRAHFLNSDGLTAILAVPARKVTLDTVVYGLDFLCERRFLMHGQFSPIALSSGDGSAFVQYKDPSDYNMFTGAIELSTGIASSLQRSLPARPLRFEVSGHELLARVGGKYVSTVPHLDGVKGAFQTGNTLYAITAGSRYNPRDGTIRVSRPQQIRIYDAQVAELSSAKQP